MKRKKKLDIIAIMLTIVSLILIGVNISLLSNKLLAPVYANNKVKKEYEEIIAKRNEEIKKITDKKTDVEMAETELKEVKKMKEKQRMQYYFSKYITYIEENKKNIDIGKTYKIQIKAYKTNGAISEIEVKENEMETNLIEENAQE